MKQQVIRAMVTNTMLITIGVVPGISATIGENIVTLRAATLQNPNTDATYSVGMNFTIAIKHMLKAEAIPNFDTEMKTGINSCYSASIALINLIKPIKLMKYETARLGRTPHANISRLLRQSAISSEVYDAIVLCMMSPWTFFI